MNARLLATLLLGLGLACPAAVRAQLPADTLLVRRSPALVKYGKWATLTAAIGMGLQAAAAHRRADRAFDRLEAYCFEVEARCDQGPGGQYLDPVAERHYQASLRHDRHARGWLLGGEATLLATAGLFIWELSRPKSPPRNIPFDPTVSVLGASTRLTLSIRF